MVHLRRREEATRSDYGQIDGGTAYVKRQRSDSPRSSLGMEVGIEDRAGPSNPSSSYRRVPELTRGSSQTSASGRPFRADGASTLEGRSRSLIDQRFKGMERSVGNRIQTLRPRKYLRPGQLAKLVDDHKRSRIPCTTLGRKRVVGDTTVSEKPIAGTVENENTAEGLSPLARSPVPTLRDFGPACPQRKKLLAPRTPLTPAAQLIVMRSPMRQPEIDSQSESHLETLPVELLVHIVCRLHHDQLKPVFHVCRRLRQAVKIARNWHFNFTTPDHERQRTVGLFTPIRHQDFYFSNISEAPGGGQAARPATPQAPRHAPKPWQSRIPLAEMRQLVAPLFQGPGNLTPHNKPPGLPRPAFRAVASHRVLFNEEELCQAVAQQTLET